jgi:hypothetical protein
MMQMCQPFLPFISGLAIKNPPNKTQKNPPNKTHLKAGFFGFYWVFLKLTSVFVAKVIIFLVKCLWKSLIWVVINI